MTKIKDLTVDDLKAEGRRWILVPGEKDVNGVRADVVFEDHPYRFAIGRLSNNPTVQPPIYLEGDDPEDSAIEWSVRHLDSVHSADDWHTIVASSIGAQVRCCQIRVVRDPQTDECRLSDGYGNEMQLSGGNAERLYQDLARAYFLPFRESCEKCDELLNDENMCDCCDE